MTVDLITHYPSKYADAIPGVEMTYRGWTGANLAVGDAVRVVRIEAARTNPAGFLDGIVAPEHVLCHAVVTKAPVLRHPNDDAPSMVLRVTKAGA